MAGENPAWGYRHIQGVLKTLGHEICAATIANILKRHGYDPNGKRRKRGISWMEFIRVHLATIWATDFFTVEVWTKRGLVTYYVLFFIHLQTRQVFIPGMAPSPTGEWITNIVRSMTNHGGALADAKYCLHDRGGQYTAEFDRILESAGVKPIRLPPRSPNLNAFAERFVLTIKSECLCRFIPLGEASLRKAIREFLEHYHAERPHQGIGNVIPFPNEELSRNTGEVKRKSRLGGLLKFYYRDAA